MQNNINEKKYSAYESFDYLKRNDDYEYFELSNELTETPTHSIELTDVQEETFAHLFHKHTVVSLRDHGFILPKDHSAIIPYCKQLHTFYHYEGIAQSGIDVIFENFMDGISLTQSKSGLKWNEVIDLLGIRYADIAKQETVYIATTYEDVIQAKDRKQVALIPSLEDANVIENELDRVDILYGLGIRCLGLTYNDANTIGTGLSENETSGLTNFGKRVVDRMNKIGMLIDISHCNEQTSFDAIEASEDPIFITHAGAKGVWNTPRMKSDELLKACAEKGGVIGICAAPNTTLSPNHQGHTIDSVMEHTEYIIDLVGIDHVAFGPDTIFGDHIALQQAFDRLLQLSESHEHEDKSAEAKECVVGVENPMESIKNMTRWLLNKGYSKADVAKIISGNALRVIEQVFNK